ncbi:hypothetical protein NFJ02_35g89310 [Pycnococcus provasolii]
MAPGAPPGGVPQEVLVEEPEESTVEESFFFTRLASLHHHQSILEQNGDDDTFRSDNDNALVVGTALDNNNLREEPPPPQNAGVSSYDNNRDNNDNYYSDKLSQPPMGDEHMHEVDRLIFARATNIRACSSELGSTVRDFNTWRTAVARQSLVPNNVLSRCTVIAGRLLRAESALRVATETMLEDLLKLTPEAMRKQLSALLADCRAERRLRLHMENERDAAVGAAAEVQQLKAGMKWGGMALRLIAKRTRQNNARRFADLHQQCRNLARRLGTVKAGRSAAQLAAERKLAMHGGGAPQRGAPATPGTRFAHGPLAPVEDNAVRSRRSSQTAMLNSALAPEKGTRHRGKNLDQFNRALHRAIEDGADRHLIAARNAKAAPIKPVPPPAPQSPTAAVMTASSPVFRRRQRRASVFRESLSAQVHTPRELSDTFEPITFRLPIAPEEAAALLSEEGAMNRIPIVSMDPAVAETVPAREWYSRTEVLQMQVAHSRTLMALQSACEERLLQANKFWKACNRSVAESAIERSVVLARQMRPTNGGGGAVLALRNSTGNDANLRAILRGGGAAFLKPDLPADAPSTEILEDLNRLDAAAEAATAAATAIAEAGDGGAVDGLYSGAESSPRRGGLHAVPFRSFRFMYPPPPVSHSSSGATLRGGVNTFNTTLKGNPSPKPSTPSSDPRRLTAELGRHNYAPGDPRGPTTPKPNARPHGSSYGDVSGGASTARF